MLQYFMFEKTKKLSVMDKEISKKVVVSIIIKLKGLKLLRYVFVEGCSNWRTVPIAIF